MKFQQNCCFAWTFLLRMTSIKLNDGKIEVTDFGMIISMFDTTIGAFRGVFFDWLKNSPFLKPLPLVDLDDFLRNLNVSFVKPKE